MNNEPQNKNTLDVLMITHNRPWYTEMSLHRLLDSCDDDTRVWIWHNGDHRPTLDVVRRFLSDSHIYAFRTSPDNKGLREPTLWMWLNSTGEYLSKVDDDCLLPINWATTLRHAHQVQPRLGIVGCWRFPEEDFRPELANRKIRDLGSGHGILQNCWVEGTGYIMKRGCLDACGPLRRNESFTQYCLRVVSRNWIIGWHYPFLYQEHMDDPRSPHSMLKSDADLRDCAPLTVRKLGVQTINDWVEAIKRDAEWCQAASINPKRHRSMMLRVRRKLFGPPPRTHMVE
jgi:hypothetical protein